MPSDRRPENLPEVTGSQEPSARKRSCSLASVLAAAVLGLLGAYSGVVFWSQRSHPPYRYPVCLSNVKNLALGVQMYLADNNEAFPPSRDWCDRLQEYTKNDTVFQCPRADNLRCAFAYNAALDGASFASLDTPTKTVVIFESDRGWNAAGGPELLPNEPRHLGGDNYGFTDGHATWVQRKRLGRDANGEPIWTKEPKGDSVLWALSGKSYQDR